MIISSQIVISNLYQAISAEYTHPKAPLPKGGCRRRKAVTGGYCAAQRHVALRATNPSDLAIARPPPFRQGRLLFVYLFCYTQMDILTDTNEITMNFIVWYSDYSQTSFFNRFRSKLI